jgi:hypothetical protein
VKLLWGLMGATLLLEAPLLVFYPLGDRTEFVAFQVAGTYAGAVSAVCAATVTNRYKRSGPRRCAETGSGEKRDVGVKA